MQRSYVTIQLLTTEAPVSCTSGCRTQDHSSYAECLKEKTVKVAYCNSAGGFDASEQKKWDKDLDFYKSARAQGVQPSGTGRTQVENAMRISDTTGTPYQAG